MSCPHVVQATVFWPERSKVIPKSGMENCSYWVALVGTENPVSSVVSSFS